MVTAAEIEATSLHFTGLVIDAMPRLREESYRLRYQVYCLESRFLPPEDYPDGMEVDLYDPHSVHLGVLNSAGELAATARLVQLSAVGLPLLDYCSIFSHETSLYDPARRVVEISRLVSQNGDERQRNSKLVLALYKAIYQTSKRRGFTHWLAASEKPLMRLLVRIGFPFRAIGPETDYHGPVWPYMMDLWELDNVISGRRKPLLNDFLDGLEPEFRPMEGAACQLS